jgi:hypothetical protein
MGTDAATNAVTELALTANLGQVRVTKATLTDTTLRATAHASAINLQDVAVSGSSSGVDGGNGGGGPGGGIELVNTKGSIYMKSVRAGGGGVTAITTEGSVNLEDVRAIGGGYRLGQVRVSTTKGEVKMHDLRVDGFIQVRWVSGWVGQEGEGGAFTTNTDTFSRFIARTFFCHLALLLLFSCNADCLIACCSLDAFIPLCAMPGGDRQR